MSVYIGFDMGGTKTLVAAADVEGNILRKTRRPTYQDYDKCWNSLNEMIAEVAEGEEIAAIGASVGGPLVWQTGVVSPLHQTEWRDVPLKDMMEGRWGVPFYVDVDTNAAVFGEYLYGGEKASRLLYVTVSTGLGGGFMVDGKIYRGLGGAHPEVGHQSINYKCSNPAGVQCECGVPDCLEALVSGNAIRRIYGVGPEELHDEGWEEVAYNLGQGLRNMVALYAPDVITLGGGVIVGRGDGLIERARQVMEEHLRIVPIPQVRLSPLGYDTALLGAVGIAIHGLE